MQITTNLWVKSRKSNPLLPNSTYPFFHLVAKDLVVDHDLGDIYPLLLMPGEGQVPVLSRFKRPLQLDKLKTDRFNLLLNQLSLLDVLNNVLKFMGQNRKGIFLDVITYGISDSFVCPN